jgi:hypothetical protein
MINSAHPVDGDSVIFHSQFKVLIFHRIFAEKYNVAAKRRGGFDLTKIKVPRFKRGILRWWRSVASFPRVMTKILVPGYFEWSVLSIDHGTRVILILFWWEINLCSWRFFKVPRLIILRVIVNCSISLGLTKIFAPGCK